MSKKKYVQNAQIVLSKNLVSFALKFLHYEVGGKPTTLNIAVNVVFIAFTVWSLLACIA